MKNIKKTLLFSLIIVVVSAGCILLYKGTTLSSVEYSPGKCGFEYPLAISITNIGFREIRQSSILLSATKKGRSTNMIISENNFNNNFVLLDISDRIIAPFSTSSMCYQAPRLKGENGKWPDVVWEISVTPFY